jgi:hypothetical protein
MTRPKPFIAKWAESNRIGLNQLGVTPRAWGECQPPLILNKIRVLLARKKKQAVVFPKEWSKVEHNDRTGTQYRI